MSVRADAGRAGHARREPAPAVLLVEATPQHVRWASGRARALGAVAGFPAGAAEWARLAPAGSPATRVLVANGAGAAAGESLQHAFRSAWRVEAEFVVPRASAAGLYCAEPRAIGVDRWLAMLGAQQRADGSAVAVVTCGAVLAVDLVDAGGRHRGGYVVPAVRQMREALYARTGALARLAALAAPAVEGLYGVNTAGGIEQGARVALASLAEHARRELEALARAPTLAFVTGSEAAELRAHLPAEFVTAPDLVLEGLACVAEEGTA